MTDPTAPDPYPPVPSSQPADGPASVAPTPVPPVAPSYPTGASPYPTAAAPFPTSAAPYPYPASAAPYPVSATPYGPPPKPRMSRWGIVFGILAGVLLLAGAGVGVLFSGERTTTTTQQTQIADLQRQVDALEDSLAETERDLQRAEDDLAELAECPDAVQALMDAVVDAGGQITESEAAPLSLDLITACGVAL